MWFVSCCSSVNISNIPFSHVPLYIYTHHRLNNDGVRVSGDAKLFVDASVLDDTGRARAIGATAADADANAGASVLDDKDRAHAVGAIATNDAGADDNGKEVDVG